jgi:Cysteine-rich CPCC
MYQFIFALKKLLRLPTDKREKQYRCPCCHYKTLRGQAEDEICPVCFWHDDGQGENTADEVWGGPNKTLSLRQARINFAEMGAVDKRVLQFVRNPLPDEQ